MNEIDVLKSIAANLSERKGSAALSNYKVLCNNLKFLNDLLLASLEELRQLIDQVETTLGDDNLVTDDAKDPSKAEYFFRRILPTIFRNDISIIEKFSSSTTADNRVGVTIESLDLLRRDFSDFNNLVTVARQFVDSLVTDAYQIVSLDAKETNFQVLTSLSSFYRFATPSLVQILFSPDLEDSLREFETLSENARLGKEESGITKSDNRSFREKIGFLFTELNISNTGFAERLRNMFHFSSEFAHVGYVSTFITGSSVSEVVFTDGISPYLPSTENFSELKYEILATGIKFIYEVYLPAIEHSLQHMIAATEVASSLRDQVYGLIEKMKSALATRNNSYVFPVVADLVGSDKTIELNCRCGNTRFWNSPYDNSELHCESCGSTFTVLQLRGGGGYIMTGEGPIRIIGTEGPEPSDEERTKLRKKYFPQPSDQPEVMESEEFQKLPQNERRVLATMAAYGESCTIYALAFLLPEISSEEMTETIATLESKDLVKRDGDSFHISPAVRDAAYESIREPNNDR